MASVELNGRDAAACLARDEDAAAVHEEIGRLPDRYRRAVVLCHFEGLTHAEAARRLRCARGRSLRSCRVPGTCFATGLLAVA